MVQSTFSLQTWSRLKTANSFILMQPYGNMLARWCPLVSWRLKFCGVWYSTLNIKKLDFWTRGVCSFHLELHFFSVQKFFFSRIGSRMELKISLGVPGSRDLSRSKEGVWISKKIISLQCENVRRGWNPSKTCLSHFWPWTLIFGYFGWFKSTLYGWCCKKILW